MDICEGQGAIVLLDKEKVTINFPKFKIYRFYHWHNNGFHGVDNSRNGIVGNSNQDIL